MLVLVIKSFNKAINKILVNKCKTQLEFGVLYILQKL